MNSFLPYRPSLFAFYFFLSLSAPMLHAAPAGEIIFVHPLRWGETWIANADGTNARQLFNRTFEEIYSLSVQEGDRYILIAAEELQKIDVYRFDLQKRRAGKNLTRGKFNWIDSAAISGTGDVIFNGNGDLHLIKAHQVEKPVPKIETLPFQDVSSVCWHPKEQQVVFTDSDYNLIHLDLVTNTSWKITADADDPAFSPNGEQIAFSASVVRKGNLWTEGIAVTTPHPNADVEMLRVRKDYLYSHPAWSPDGQYIAYASYTNLDIEDIAQWQAIGTFVVPVAGGEPEPILRGIKGLVWLFDWANKTYPVAPADSLVMSWGKLKTKHASLPVGEPSGSR